MEFLIARVTLNLIGREGTYDFYCTTTLGGGERRIKYAVILIF